MELTLTYVMAVITLIGSLANAKKLRIGFVLWSIANTFWIFRNIMIGEYAQSAVFIANLCISIYGFICWGNSNNTTEKIQDVNDPYQGAFDDDLFYVRESQGNVQWLYYNPDSNAGGQYVDSIIDCYQILEAAKHEDPRDFFYCLGEECKQWLIDVGTDDFEAYDRQFNEDPYSFKGADADTRARLIVFAKKYMEERHGN